MNIEVHRLDPEDKSIDYVFGLLFQTPYIFQQIKEDNKYISSFVKMIDRWRIGRTLVYLPMINEEPAGLFYGAWNDKDDLVSHVAFKKKFWGKGTVLAGRQVLKQVDADNTGCQFVGYIPKDNKASLSYSKMIGFNPKKAKVEDEKLKDYWRMVCRLKM